MYVLCTSCFLNATCSYQDWRLLPAGLDDLCICAHLLGLRASWIHDKENKDRIVCTIINANVSDIKVAIFHTYIAIYNNNFNVYGTFFVLSYINMVQEFHCHDVLLLGLKDKNCSWYAIKQDSQTIPHTVLGIPQNCTMLDTPNINERVLTP